LHVDLRVQLLQLLCSQLLRDGREQLGNLRVLLDHFLTHVERRVVDREEALVVFDELEVERLDATVGLEHLTEVALLTLVGLLVDQTFVYLDDVLLRELEIVGFLHSRQAVVAG
jgi:hypothetical protein